MVQSKRDENAFLLLLELQLETEAEPGVLRSLELGCFGLAVLHSKGLQL